MKILWEPFSFLSTPFVRHTTHSKPHRYVIAIAVFALLFAQCLCHNLTTDKPNDNVNATQKKWLNDNRHAVPGAIEARVAISKRQSPTKISNSSSSSRMSSRSYGPTDIPTSRNYYEKSTLSILHGGGSFPTIPPPTSTKLVTTQRKQRINPPADNVLIVIQTKKNIELNLVRDQFQQFTDMFGVKLQNITIDFDAVDGK